MRREDFHYHLPEHLIAKQPTDQRTGSRLLCLDGNSGVLEHRQFTDILDYVNEGDLLVLNNTEVIPARLYGQKLTGGKIEILVERVLDSARVLAHIKSSKSPKVGTTLLFNRNHEDLTLNAAQNITAEVMGRQDTLFEVKFLSNQTVLDILNSIGHMPLPPYIDRQDDAQDRLRYQTVYGQKPGAVAAPTAGLHFDEPMLNKLKQKGVQIAFVTLHVGAGTFQPVRVDNIHEHKMHAEYFEISQAVVDTVKRTKLSGHRVIAVGTTSVRTLESSALAAAKEKGDELLVPLQTDTDIFIYPGKKFRIVDGLITNFHLPESTLIMLVSAFAGYDNTIRAYKEAVDSEYRFFSYGDAMFLTHNPKNDE